MRRKIFLAFAIIIFIVFVFDYLDFDLCPRKSNIVGLSSIESDFLLKVISYKEDSEKISLTCNIVNINGNDCKYKGKVLIKIYDKDIPGYQYLYNYFIYKGSFGIPQGKRDPHCFDYQKYLLGKGIYLTSYVTKSPEIINSNKNLIEKIHFYINLCKEDFSNNLSEDTKGILLGILFGDTKDLDDVIYESFRLNGTSHILAISGLHIGILYDLLEKLFKKKKNRITNILICFILFLYGMLSMWSVSITRAILMIYLKIIAKEFDLRYDTLTSLSIVGIILIILNPYVVFLTGFQLSFLAVLSICIIYPALPEKIPAIVKTSLSVTIGSIGYQALVFNYVTPLSIIANIPIIFISTYLVPFAFIMFIAFIFLGSSFLPLFLIEYISKILIYVNFFTTIKGVSCIEVTSKGAFALLIISIIFFVYNIEYFKIQRIRRNKKKLRLSYFLLIISFTLSFFMYYDPITNDDLIFIDVGQGDAIHIKYGNTDILIDGGGNVNYNIGEKTLKTYLLKNGVRDIDLSLLTHTHTDHYLGLKELSKVFKVKQSYSDCLSNDTFYISEDIYIKTLWPNSHSLSKEENENCSVFMIYYKGKKILVTGDLDEKGENKLLKYYTKDELKCDILKVGHHGSETSSSLDFLKATSPTYAIIQVGKNNYGHPSNDTLYKLDTIGAIILRNDLNGAIGFKFKNGNIICHTCIN